MRLLFMANSPFHLLEHVVPIPGELSDGCLVQDVGPWQVDCHGDTCLSQPKSRLTLEVRLQVQPVCHVVLGVVHDQYDGHRLAQPTSEIGSLNRARNGLSVGERASLVCSLELDEHLAVVAFAVGVKRKDEAVHAIVVRAPLQREAGSQHVTLDVVEG
jgi:hypothetical protein